MVKYWKDQVSEILANLHPHEIEEGIIKPAINQVIEDYDDSLSLYTKDEGRLKRMTENLIMKWETIKKMI